MKFNGKGRKLPGINKTVYQQDDIYIGLESEYGNISSNAIDIARDMVHEKRIPDFFNILKNLEKSLE